MLFPISEFATKNIGAFVPIVPRMAFHRLMADPANTELFHQDISKCDTQSGMVFRECPVFFDIDQRPRVVIEARWFHFVTHR